MLTALEICSLDLVQRLSHSPHMLSTMISSQQNQNTIRMDTEGIRMELGMWDFLDDGLHVSLHWIYVGLI